MSAIPYAWIVVVLALLATMGEGFIQQGLPILFPFIKEDFGASLAQLGLITSGLFLGATSTTLIMGWLADRMGVRKIISVGLLAMTAGLLLFSQIKSLNQGVVLAFLISLTTAGITPASVKAIMDWVTPQTRGLSMGIKETSVPLSGIVAAALFPFLAAAYSWRTAVLVLGLIVGVLGMVIFASYRNKPDSGTSGGRPSLIRGIVTLASDRDIWLVGFSSAILLALYLVVGSYLILFLIEKLGMSVSVAASFLAIAFAASVVGRVFWGLISDLLGGRPAVILALVCALSMLGTISMIWLPSDAPGVVVGVLAAFLGVTALGWTGVYLALVVGLVQPELVGTGIGFVTIFARTGAFGPPLFGLIVDRTGSYDMGWWMMAGLASVGALLLTFVRRRSMYR